MMAYRQTFEFRFSAAHSLPHMPEGHPCRGVHGHNYRAWIVVEAETLPESGELVERAAFARIATYIAQTLNGCNLDDVIRDDTTDANIAHHLWSVAQGVGVPVKRVVVESWPGMSAEYER